MVRHDNMMAAVFYKDIITTFLRPNDQKLSLFMAISCLFLRILFYGTCWEECRNAP